MKKIIFSLIFAAGLFWYLNLFARQTNYKFAAIYIYSFTKYIEWPESQIKNEFVIGVYGYSPMVQELIAATNGKKVADKNISIKIFNSPDEIVTCRILFIPTEKESELSALTKIANSRHILVVTEGKNLAQKGAAINLVNLDGKQKFELNESAAKKAGLKISDQLLPLAIVVN